MSEEKRAGLIYTFMLNLRNKRKQNLPKMKGIGESSKGNKVSGKLYIKGWGQENGLINAQKVWLLFIKLVL